MLFRSLAQNGVFGQLRRTSCRMPISLLQGQHGNPRALIVRAAQLCCAIAMAGSAPAASDPPPPSGWESAKKPHASAGAAVSLASQSAPEQRGSASAPLFVQTIPAAESAADATHKEYERHEKPALDRRLTVGTEFLAAFTFLLFCFTAALWWVTYRLSKDARDASARQAWDMQNSLRIAGDMVCAANESATAATKSARIAGESAVRQQRAYVNVFKVFASWHPDATDKLRPITITVETRNAGQTPAHKVFGWMNSKNSKEMPLDFPRPSQDGQPQSVGLQAPGQVNHFQRPRTLVLDTESEIEIWQSGRESLYVWGEIQYIDAFDAPRQTRFRYVMTREGMHPDGGKFMSCNDGNDAT